MRRKVTVLIIAAGLSLSACESFNPQAIGDGAREAESALCPLQTARNLDNTLDTILALIPLIQWEPVCADEA
jgi:starvation-inducible outer membrane lipoprotein